MKKIKLGKRFIGQGDAPYFIADIGANHDGSLEKAFKLIQLAKEAGADAAKFQNFKANKIVSKIGFENLGSQISHQAKWKKSVFEVYEDASISQDWTPLLKKKCDEVGIDYFTSPYDFDSVDHVDPYVDLFKIGSGDITWLEIIEYIAKKKKPVLIATGASEMSDVVRAINTIEAYNDEIVLMQCNTNYTLDSDKYKNVNLNVLKTFSIRFPNAILGLSDHTIGHATVLGAIALGAVFIEKHFTDSNDNNGPDHKFAMDPKAWREMVDNANVLFYSLGNGFKTTEENEIEAKVVQRRCLRASRDIYVGEILKKEDFEVLRPAPIDSFAPFEISKFIGKTVSKKIIKGEHFTKNFFIC
jgi:N-acetylneuraminate synthase